MPNILMWHKRDDPETHPMWQELIVYILIEITDGNLDPFILDGAFVEMK
jgi:hypothetical protein